MESSYTSPASEKEVSATAAILTAVVLLGALIAYCFPWTSGELNFVPEHCQLLGMTETTAQRRVHQIALAIILLSAFVGMVLLRKSQWLRSFPAKAAKALLEPLAWWGLPFAAVFFFLMLKRTSLLNLAIVLGIWICVLANASRLNLKPARLAIWMGAVALLACLMIPGILGVPDLRAGGLGLRNIEWHYSIMVMCGDRLAAGERLIEDVRIYYGPLVPTATAILQRTFGAFSFADHVRFVQYFQIAFAVVFTSALLLMRPRHPFQVLVPLLMVLPWIHNNHIACYFPNQSGWRSLGLPAGVALMLLAGEGIGGLMVLLYGMASGLLILFNPETGLCLTAGILVFLAGGARSMRISVVARYILIFPAGLLISIMTFISLFKIGLGVWPFESVRDLLSISPFLSNIGKSYGGLPLTADIVAFFIFTHATYIFLRQAFTWSRRPLNVKERTIGGVAAAILLWFGYFLNRPAAWNLWTHIALYAFLVFEYLTPEPLQQSWKRLGRGKIPLGGLLFVLVLGPGVLSHFLEACSAVKNHERIYFGAPPEKEMVSGVLIDYDAAIELSAKANLVAKLARDKGIGKSNTNVMYFTVNSFLMPKLSGVASGVPFGSVVAEVFRQESYKEMVNLTFKRDPAIILFDDPASRLAGLPEERAFFARLRGDFSGKYRRTAFADGWEIWKKRK